jgi:hypothetical protein
MDVRIRALLQSDIPALKRMAEEKGYPYPFLDDPSSLEMVRVVDDGSGRPLAAVAVERILQVYLLCGAFDGPMNQIHAMRLLDDDISPALKLRGWRDVNAFLPPNLAKQFGRRLEKTFGWMKEWPCWSKRL